MIIFDKKITWAGVKHRLLGIDQYLTMVCFLAEFDTNTNNDGGDQQDSDDTANHSTSYNTSRGTESKSYILINSLKIQLFKKYEKRIIFYS